MKHACTFVGMLHQWGPWHKRRVSRHYSAADVRGKERRLCRQRGCYQDSKVKP